MAGLPPYAYVPGQNARHPDDFFDGIKASVTPDLMAAQLHKTAAWSTGLAYFHAGYFWECHEVLEAVWMQAPQGTPEREMVQALIQLANARLKLRMKRKRAVSRLCDMVEVHLARCPAGKPVMALSLGQMLQWTADTRQALHTK